MTSGSPLTQNPKAGEVSVEGVLREMEYMREVISSPTFIDEEMSASVSVLRSYADPPLTPR